VQRLTEQILDHAGGLPEGSPIAAKSRITFGIAFKMPKRAPMTDFRATRALLSDEAFALVTGKRSGPTDLVVEDVWNGIVHLPDDVARTTSNHHGSQLAAAYSLWGDWVEAIGDDHDEMFTGMLDAADCFQASTFNLLHGYYRSALANLRSAIELVAIGSLGNRSPADPGYVRWAKHNIGSLPFATAVRKLRGATKGSTSARGFEPNCGATIRMRVQRQSG